MAQVKLRNSREHDITLTVLVNAEVVQCTVPASRASQLAPNVMIPGYALCEEEIIKKLKKTSQAVKAYFDEGWLQIVSNEEEAPASDQAPAT